MPPSSDKPSLTARRTRARPPGRGRSSASQTRRATGEEPGDGWIWGRHAVLAALANPRRTVRRSLATQNAARQHPDIPWEVVAPAVLDSDLPPGAVHQGMAVRVDALEPDRLADMGQPAAGMLVLLDQVTDPHNVGAVLRSARAFGARGVILQDRKAPPFMGACAKAAVGAAETVAHAREVNLSRALESLHDWGWMSFALAADADVTLEDGVRQARDAAPQSGVILALGSEDKGLRPSVAQACSARVRIPMEPGVESLNVSTAAAVALYAARAVQPSA